MAFSPLNTETAALPLNVLAGDLKHWLLQLLVSQLAHKFASIVLNNLAVHGLVIRRTLADVYCLILYPQKKNCLILPL